VGFSGTGNVDLSNVQSDGSGSVNITGTFNATGTLDGTKIVVQPDVDGGATTVTVPPQKSLNFNGDVKGQGTFEVQGSVQVDNTTTVEVDVHVQASAVLVVSQDATFTGQVSFDGTVSVQKPTVAPPTFKVIANCTGEIRATVDSVANLQAGDHGIILYYDPTQTSTTGFTCKITLVDGTGATKTLPVTTGTHARRLLDTSDSASWNSGTLSYTIASVSTSSGTSSGSAGTSSGGSTAGVNGAISSVALSLTTLVALFVTCLGFIVSL